MATGITSDDMESKQIRCPNFFFPQLYQKKEKKKMEILALATIWMNLEDIMLNDISQSQKGRYCIIPFT